MKDRLLALVVGVGALAYLYSDYGMPRLALGDPLGPRAFPAIVGVLLLISAIMLALEKRRERPASAVSVTSTRVNHLPVLACMVVWTIVYYSVFEPLGYIVATIPYLFGLLWFFNPRKPAINAAVAIGFTGLAYGVFSRLLQVQLPRGLIGL